MQKNHTPNHAFNLNEYRTVIIFCLWGEWTIRNFETSFKHWFIDQLNTGSKINKLEINYDEGLAFEMLDVISFEIIKQHSKGFEMFKRYKNAIEISGETKGSRMLAIVHFIHNHFYDAFPSYYLQLQKENKFMSSLEEYTNCVRYYEQMTEAERQELSAWEEANCDQNKIGTKDWPRWAEIIKKYSN